MRIDSSQRVGIGTSSPTNALSVEKSITGDFVAEFKQGHSNAGNSYGVKIEGGTNASDTAFLVANQSGTNMFEIQGDGKVGIGETTPLGKLHVKSADSGLSAAGGNGDELVLENDGECGLSILSGASANGNIFFGDSGGSATGIISYNHANNYMAFNTNGGNERMRINSSGNVGIGETNPDASLHITSNTPVISFDESDASQEFRIGSFGGAFAVYDSTDSAYRMVINGDGKVGVGTTSPSSNLHIVSGGSTGTLNSDADELVVQGTRGGLSILSNNGEPNTIAFGDVSDADVGKLIYDHGSNAMTFTTNTSERMRIDSSGNVGIGNSTPNSFNLQARNLVVGTGSGPNGLTIYSENNSSGNIFFADGTSGSDPVRGGITYKHDDNVMQFRVNDVNRVTIDSSGNITVTGTVDGRDVAADGTKLDGIAAGATNVTNNNQLTNGAGYITSNGLANLSNNGNNLSGSFTATGNITAYSDERLKDNIVTIDNALDKVSQMRGVTYTKDNEKGSGVIAQELEKIAPELVLDGEYKSVAYGNVVGYLIEAIKELKQEIKQLKKEK